LVVQSSGMEGFGRVDHIEEYTTKLPRVGGSENGNEGGDCAILEEKGNNNEHQGCDKESGKNGGEEGRSDTDHGVCGAAGVIAIT